MKKLLILLLPLFLVACAGGDMPDSATQAPEPEPIVEETQPSLTENVVEAVDEIPAPPPEPKGEDLKGKTPEEVLAMIGDPSFVRRDGLMQSILFISNSCVLDVVFYATATEEPFLADYISARTSGGETVEVNECLARLVPDGWLNTKLDEAM